MRMSDREIADLNKPAVIESAVILAGGSSLRMGFDKQLLRIGGARVIDSMAARLSSEFSEIIISTNKPELYADTGLTALPDRLGAGPLAGIYSSLRFCSSEYLYVIACDMPFISPGYIRYMKALIRNGHYDACVTMRPDGYYEPFNAFYNKSALRYIEDALLKSRYGINRLLDRMNMRVISAAKAAEFNCPNMFFNANSKQDLNGVRMDE